jgi:hypothetical protein
MGMAQLNDDLLHQEALTWVLSANADELVSISNESRRMDHERAKAKERVLRERQNISIAVRKSLKATRDIEAKSERRRKRLVMTALFSLSLVPVWMAFVAGSHYYEGLPASNQGIAQQAQAHNFEAGVAVAEESVMSAEPAYGQMAQATTSFGVLSSGQSPESNSGPVNSAQKTVSTAKKRVEPVRRVIQDRPVAPPKVATIDRKVVPVRAVESSSQEPVNESKPLGLISGSGTLTHSQPQIRSISDVVAGDVIAPRGVSGVKGEKVLSVMPNGDVLTDLRLIGKGKLKNFQIVG